MIMLPSVNLMLAVEAPLSHGEALLQPAPLKAAGRGLHEPPAVIKARLAAAVLTAVGPHLPGELPSRWATLERVELAEALPDPYANGSDTDRRQCADTLLRAAVIAGRLRDVVIAGGLPVPGWVADALGRPPRRAT